MGSLGSVASDPVHKQTYNVEVQGYAHAIPLSHAEQHPIYSVKAGELTLEEDAAGGLGRHLGLFSTTLLIIGRIIGTGIFATPSSITSNAGSVGAALLLWILGFGLAMSGLLVWLELGCLIPRSGGEKVYLEAAYKRPRHFTTIVFAFQSILLGFSAGGCISFAANMILAADVKLSEHESRGIAGATIVFVSLMHGLTPRLGVKIMNVVGVIKVIVLFFIIITGFVVLGGGTRVEDPGRSFRNAFKNSSSSGNQYAMALLKVMGSFAGWSNAAYILNEVKNPVRTLRIAGPLALTMCGILYLLTNIAFYSAATPQEVANSGITVAAVFMNNVFGKTAARVLSVFVGLSALGNIMTQTFSHARVCQELAKEGILPLGSLWAGTWPFGAPTGGLLLHFIPSIIMTMAIPFGDAYNFIVNVEEYPRALIFFLVVIGLLILRKSEPSAHRPFRVWLPVAAFGLVGQVFLLVAPFLRPPEGKGDTSQPYWSYPLVGIAVMVAGMVYWLLFAHVLPGLGKYRLDSEKVVLSDGTHLMKFVKTSLK